MRKRIWKPRNPILPGEFPLKLFLSEEAERTGLCHIAIWKRIQRGFYPTLKQRKINKRLVYCTHEAPQPIIPEPIISDENQIYQDLPDEAEPTREG